MAGMNSSSKSLVCIIIVFWVFLIFLTYEVSGGHKEPVHIKNQLRSIKKNTIKTIQTAHGDVYDCVDIYKQPAFSHPKLKDHVIQMKPTISLEETQHLFNISSSSTAATLEEVEECPLGSVPIRRLELDYMLKEKLPLRVEPTKATGEHPQKFMREGRFKTFVAVTRTKTYEHVDNKIYFFGGAASINIYGVPDVGPEDVSASVMWIINKEFGVVLRAGWLVSPDRYKDSRTRMFIQWSVDNDKTHCMDTDCPGFVLVNNTPVLGMAFEAVSEIMGPQYITTVFIYKDKGTRNWWFAVGDPNSVVGYWPRDIFGHRFRNGHNIDYGGFISCSIEKKCPTMGNGLQPGGIVVGGYDRACFIQDVQYYDSSYRPRSVTHGIVYAVVTDTTCSNVGKFQDDKHSFTFGGAGC